MTELNIEKFSPKKAELQAKADQYKSLTIKGVDDKEGYLAVDEARKDLKVQRRSIERFSEDLLKQMRDKYNISRKEVLDLTEEHVGIIKPLEDQLKEKQEDMDREILKTEMINLLPDRKERLKNIDVQVSDDEILMLSPEEFTTFFNEKNAIHLEEKERKLKEKEDEVARLKAIEEAKKEARQRAEEEAEKERVQAKKDAEEKAKRVAKETEEEAERKAKEAEEEKKKAVKEAEEKAEKEKQALIDKQKKEEEERIEAEKKAKKEEQEKVEKEAKEKEELEKEEKYKKWLEENGYNEDPPSFYIAHIDDKIILYKHISTFNPK
jgi:hypothetical protein